MPASAPRNRRLRKQRQTHRQGHRKGLASTEGRKAAYGFNDSKNLGRIRQAHLYAAVAVALRGGLEFRVCFSGGVFALQHLA